MDEKLGQLSDPEKSNPSLPAENMGTEELPVIDPHEEAKLVRKLDLFIIPITMLLCELSPLLDICSSLSTTMFAFVAFESHKEYLHWLRSVDNCSAISN